MLRFEVKQEDTYYWTVSSQGRTLYSYATEKEARMAALAFARDMSATGTQASVLITPTQLKASNVSKHAELFTGM
jgi:predicted sugar kinase